MSDSQSHVTASDVTLPVIPPLSLSSLDAVMDDDAFAITRREDFPDTAGDTITDSGLCDEGVTTARDIGLPPSGAKRERTFGRKKKRHRSVGDVDFNGEGTRRKSRNFKRSDSLDSVVGPSTSRSILKRDSVVSDMYSHNRQNHVPAGAFTDRPRRLSSLGRKVSFKGSYSEPPTPIEQTARKKIVSFGYSPRDLELLNTGRRKSSTVGLSPVKPRALFRRRESMMNTLRTELIKTNKLRLPERPGIGTGKNLDIRKEKSSDEILWSGRRDSKVPLQKRMSMPALGRRESDKSFTSDEDEVFVSTFQRRKLTLLSSLEKMGVKLPKRTQRLNSTVEADVLKRAGKIERHGSLTSRTVMSNFDVQPSRKPKATPRSPDQKLDDATRSKLQQIFDTLTKEDAQQMDQAMAKERQAQLKEIVDLMKMKNEVTALPGLVGRNRHSITDKEIAGSTANVFLSRLRRRKDLMHSLRSLQHFAAPANPGLHLSHAVTGPPVTEMADEDNCVGLDEVNKLSDFHTENAEDVSFESGISDANSAVSSKNGTQRRENGSSLDTTSGIQRGLKGQTGNCKASKSDGCLETESDFNPSLLLSETCQEDSFESEKTSPRSPRAVRDNKVVVKDSFESEKTSPRSPRAVRDNKVMVKDSSAKLQLKVNPTKAKSSLLIKSRASKAKQIQALTQLRGAVFSRSGKLSDAVYARIYRRETISSTDYQNGHMVENNVGSHTDFEGKDAVGGRRVSMVMKRHRRLGKRGGNRFRNLAKFVCLLLRAWRMHSLAVHAILDYVHTVDVSLDGQGKDGLLFDITEYKADKEARLSSEAIRILKKRPAERTSDEIHYVQIALWNYKSLAEYPVHMQKMIAERAWFESYGANRVIVREGHLPMCFYFVLSGTALVSVMDLDKGVAKTVMYYNRGDSFGELAIMNGSRRQSTVISKDNIQLLVLADTDFVEVFMSGGLKNPDDPFLNSLSYLDGWPKEKLSENPKKANYSYFKRGTVLVADSHKNDWVIIVKSGSVNLLKKLKAVDAKKIMNQRAARSFQEKLQELLAEEERTGQVTHEERVEDVFQHKQDEVEKLGHLVRFYALPQIFVDTNEDYNEMKRQHDEFTELHGVTALHAREMAATAMSEHLQNQEQQLSRGVTSASLDRQGTGTSLDARKLGSLVKKGPYMSNRGKTREGSSTGNKEAQMESRKNTSLSAFFRDNASSATEDTETKKPTKAPPSPMFVNVQTLTKGMVFGLSDLFFDNQPSMTLVSNGAECISISKKLFMEHASHAFVARIREDIYPYPTEEDLQENLESQIVWNFHRREVVTHVIQDIKWTRADKSDARLNISPSLGY